MIKAGDKVKVIDWGKQYTTYPEWFKNHKDDLKYEWVIKYRYNNNMYTKMKHEKDNNIYDVLYVDEKYALISTTYDRYFNYSLTPSGTYLINITGLEKIKPKSVKEYIIPIRMRANNNSIIKFNISNGAGGDYELVLNLNEYNGSIINIDGEKFF